MTSARLSRRSTIGGKQTGREPDLGYRAEPSDEPGELGLTLPPILSTGLPDLLNPRPSPPGGDIDRPEVFRNDCSLLDALSGVP